MAAAQRRLITAENSRLGKVPDLAAMLQSENAWSTLPRETREHLYALLPPADDSESERDPDVNPLLIARLKPYITEELTRFKEDLKDGKETKKWRADAMQAGQDHIDGKFDEWKFKAREEYWGKPEDAHALPKTEGDDEHAEGVEVNEKGHGETNGTFSDRKDVKGGETGESEL